MQRIAVEVENEPLGKHGGQEGVANNPNGSNQYQKAEVDGGYVVTSIQNDTKQESAETETPNVNRQNEFSKNGNSTQKERKPPNRGNSEVYLTRRIARDHPDILKKMQQGKYRSVRAAAMDAGIVEKRLSIPVDPAKAAIALGKHFKNQDRSLLIEVLLQQPE